MYKSTDSEHQQLSFFQFNASCGMQLDSQNEWVKDANRLPWKVWEASYASMFPGIKRAADGQISATFPGIKVADFCAAASDILDQFASAQRSRMDQFCLT